MPIFAVIFILIAFDAKAAPSAVEQKRLEIVQQLRKQNYFLEETCPRVASDVLKKFGLPPLGQTKPVKGKRGKFSRPKKPQLLPNLQDEITPSKGLNIRIQMRSLDKTRPPKWRIKVERKVAGKKPLILATEFQFVSRPHKTHDVCELSAVTFRSRKMDVRACIDLFLASHGATSSELKWIKDDCALALHYSPEVKKMAKP